VNAPADNAANPKKRGPTGKDTPQDAVRRRKIAERRGCVGDVYEFLAKKNRKKTFYR